MALRRNDDVFSSPKRRRTKGDYRSASIDSLVGPGPERKPHRRNKASSGQHARPQASMRNADPKYRRNGRTLDHGEIDHVVPQTRTRESAADYSRRSRRADRYYSAKAGAGATVRRFLPIVVVIVLAIVAVAVVSSLVYNNSVSSAMALDDSEVDEALVAPDEDSDAYYVLLAGDFGSAFEDPDGIDSLILARIDPTTPQVSLMAIPGNMVVGLSNGESGGIGGEQGISGDAGLISAVAEYAEVDIAHYVRIDADGLVSLVDAMDGVEVDVATEVDDPDAGDIYIAAGRQTLNGDQALVFSRATNFADGSTQRAENQMALLQALVAGVIANAESVDLDAVSSAIKTDLTADELRSLINMFSEYDAGTAYLSVVPGSDSTDDDGVTSFYGTSDTWATMLEAFTAGDDPDAATSVDTSSVKPGKYTVIVKNGSGTTGAADEVATVLEDAGYTVTDTGNTDAYVYTETLVVYKKAKNEAVAQAIVDELGTGRAVSASIYYSFDENIQVIVGSDWMPSS